MRRIEILPLTISAIGLYSTTSGLRTARGHDARRQRAGTGAPTMGVAQSSLRRLRQLDEWSAGRRSTPIARGARAFARRAVGPIARACQRGFRQALAPPGAPFPLRRGRKKGNMRPRASKNRAGGALAIADLILRSRAKRGGSKDGQEHGPHGSRRACGAPHHEGKVSYSAATVETSISSASCTSRSIIKSVLGG